MSQPEASSPREPRPALRLLAGLLATLVLAGLTVASIWAVLPPSPKPADAPTNEFSAARAYTHVQKVSQEVHVAGSPEAASVRSYLVSTLEGLGLRVEQWEGTGATDNLGGYAMAHVHNVIAVLPGTNPTGRVFLVAHYDSAQVSHGANDDGVGVATLLETARALVRGPAQRNDVVFVFTDAEEACLCGAEAFVHRHDLARAGGVVLNVEARGANGPSVMFETNAGNAGVVGVYAEHAEHPVATSFAVEVYRILPNDTDFTPFRESGRFTGLNSAYIDGVAAYHSPDDTAAAMNQGSLQQHGDNALALTRAFAAADLHTLSQPSAGDLTYFPLLGYLVHYPGSLVWPIAGAALLAVAVLFVLVRRRRLATVGQLIGGFFAALLPLVLAPIAAQALWAALVALRPDYAPLIDPWRPGWYRVGVIALVLAVLGGWFGLLRRRVSGWALATGGLAWLAVLGLALAAFTPGGSYLAAIPALAVAVAGIVALAVPGRPLVGLAVLTVGAGLSVLVLAPTVLMFFPALGLATGGAAALFAMMAALTLLPVLEHLYPAPVKPSPVLDSGLWETEPRDRHPLWVATPALVAAVLAVAAVGVGLATDRFDATHPTRTHLMYALDTDNATAHWVSLESDPVAWTRQHVQAPGDLSAGFPLLPDDAWIGPAQAAALPAPELTTVSNITAGDRRTVELLIKPQREVRLVYLQVRGAGVLEATADGRAVRVDGGSTGVDPFGLLFHAPPATGLSVRLVVQGTAAFQVRVIDGSDGLEQLPGFHPRPTGVGVLGSHTSELVVVAKTYDIDVPTA